MRYTVYHIQKILMMINIESMNKKLRSNFFVEYYIDKRLMEQFMEKNKKKIHHRSLNCEHN